MSPSILSKYKRIRGILDKKNKRTTCEDCFFFNPFGKFCELHLHKKGFWDFCDEFEDRKKNIDGKTKNLGEVPK